MPADQMIFWCAVCLLIAVGITGLMKWLDNLAKRNLAQWTVVSARAQLARSYPGKSLVEVAAILAQRDSIFSPMVRFLPRQGLIGLVVAAAVWYFLKINPNSFFLRLVQNLFILEFFILALYPSFKIMAQIQYRTLVRVRELLQKK